MSDTYQVSNCGGSIETRERDIVREYGSLGAISFAHIILVRAGKSSKRSPAEHLIGVNT